MMRFVVLAATAALLAACGEITFTMPPYQPVNTLELKGALAAEDFVYRPKEGVKQNEIRETAAGTVLMTEPVPQFYVAAVRRELRQSGLSLLSDKCVLNGTIYDFALESLGYSATYITDVEYVVRARGGETLHTSRHMVKFTTSKFLAAPLVLANIQKSVSDNIAQFMAEPGFVSALARCR